MCETVVVIRRKRSGVDTDHAGSSDCGSPLRMLTTGTLHEPRRRSGKRDSKCQRAQCRRKVGRFEVRGGSLGSLAENWGGWREDAQLSLATSAWGGEGVV